MVKLIKHRSLAPVWVFLASTLLSLCWLIPNHSSPWTAFHSDAVAATVLTVIGFYVVLTKSEIPKLNFFNLGLVVLMVVPWIQLLTGQLVFLGQAWMGSVYLLGFLFAMLVGQYWSSRSGILMGDVIFLAVGLAALLSVGMEFKQWLMLENNETLNFWVMKVGNDRPHANIGQPNQLATLLLWGILAGVWGLWRGKLRGWVVLMLAIFLSAGIALTQSRTAGFGLLAFFIFAWYWRKKLIETPAGWGIVCASLALLIVYTGLLVWMNDLSRLLFLPEKLQLEGRLGPGLRPQAWQMFLGAALEHPWWGYGWNQTIAAHFEVAEKFPALNTPFSQAHNLIIDLVLWLGIPLGLIFSVGLVYGFVLMIRKVSSQQHAIYVLMIFVIGIHALLEYPLHYAYFLLPTGIVLGVLAADLKILIVNSAAPKLVHRLAWIVAVSSALALAVTIRDYVRVESEYLALAVERAQIENSRIAVAPDVWTLTDQAEIQTFMKFTPTSTASLYQLEVAEAVTKSQPSTQNFLKVALMAGINGQPEKAGILLSKMCKTVPKAQCISASAQWKEMQKTYPSLSSVNWTSIYVP